MLSRLTYEHHQPPLYYLLAAVVWRLAPQPELVKLVNLGLSCLVLCLPLALARARGWEDGWHALLATVVLALSPMRCFMAVSIGNGILAELIFGVYTVAIAASCPAALVGVIIGVGALAKIPMLLALPLYVLWLRLDREDRSWREILRSGAIASAVALAIMLPWIGHNIAAYGPGDPLALETGALGSDAETAAALGTERPRLTLLGEHGIGAFSWRLFASWWGAFGWMEIFPDPRLIPVYLGLTAIVLAGLFIRWRQPVEGRDEARRWIAWSLGAVASAIMAVSVYSLSDFQPQGRYLFVVSIASSVLFAIGLASSDTALDATVRMDGCPRPDRNQHLQSALGDSVVPAVTPAVTPAEDPRPLGLILGHELEPDRRIVPGELEGRFEVDAGIETETGKPRNPDHAVGRRRRQHRGDSVDHVAHESFAILEVVVTQPHVRDTGEAESNDDGEPQTPAAESPWKSRPLRPHSPPPTAGRHSARSAP